jgi:4a-hydroxytetrahydrobiopterin dehydratase
MSVSDLSKGHCKPCEGGMPPLADAAVQANLARLTGWQVVDGELTKTYAFKNYHDTMAFVNAAAWVSHREDHHPDMEVGYNKCTMHYVTHAIGGLSDNDFICAAKIDALFDL